MSESFTQQAEEIKKEIDNWEYAKFSSQSFHGEEVLKAKAKALQEAGQRFLEFLEEIQIQIGSEELVEEQMFGFAKITDKIADIQNGLKLLDEVLK